MIEINDLSIDSSKGLVDVTANELRSIRGGDGLGAAIGGASGFSAAGVVSGGDVSAAINGGAAAGATGAIPAASYPAVGIPAAVVIGTAVGVASVFSSGSQSFTTPPFAPGEQNMWW